MGYSTANRRQKRKDTGVVISKRVLFYEAWITYECYCGWWCHKICISEDVESTNSDNEDDKELREPDYDEDKVQLEEKQEEETGEIVSTNQVF